MSSRYDARSTSVSLSPGREREGETRLSDDVALSCLLQLTVATASFPWISTELARPVRDVVDFWTLVSPRATRGIIPPLYRRTLSNREYNPVGDFTQPRRIPRIRYRAPDSINPLTARDWRVHFAKSRRVYWSAEIFVECDRTIPSVC